MKINRNNYEDFLIQKLEGLLSTEQNAELDLFLHNNADIRSEWEAFELTRLIPDDSLVYEHKDFLKKKQSAGVIPMYRTMLFVTSIAASLLLVFFVSQKYLFIQPTEIPVVVAENNSMNNIQSIENNKPSGSNSNSASNNNAIVADNFQIETQPAFSKQIETSNHKQTANSPFPVSISHADIQPMKQLEHTAMKTYPRVSYASFIWTKGLTKPQAPVRTTTEAGAWLQIASVLGSEIVRLSGRGERLNKAPIELQIKNNPIQLNINNPYLKFHKIISFKKKNSNNNK